jgi:hypothetical protein
MELPSLLLLSRFNQQLNRLSTILTETPAPLIRSSLDSIVDLYALTARKLGIQSKLVPYALVELSDIRLQKTILTMYGAEKSIDEVTSEVAREMFSDSTEVYAIRRRLQMEVLSRQSRRPYFNQTFDRFKKLVRRWHVPVGMTLEDLRDALMRRLPLALHPQLNAFSLHEFSLDDIEDMARRIEVNNKKTEALTGAPVMMMAKNTKEDKLIMPSHMRGTEFRLIP